MNISVMVRHTLETLEAIAKVMVHMDKLLATFGDKISNIKAEWTGNILSFSFNTVVGQVSGTVAVGEDEVILDVTTPRIAWFVKNKIKRQIRHELETCLE